MESNRKSYGFGLIQEFEFYSGNCAEYNIKHNS